jgi:hypothetical protein
MSPGTPTAPLSLSLSSQSLRVLVALERMLGVVAYAP